METEIQQFEQEAYYSVLRAFNSQSDALTWIDQARTSRTVMAKERVSSKKASRETVRAPFLMRSRKVLLRPRGRRPGKRRLGWRGHRLRSHRWRHPSGAPERRQRAVDRAPSVRHSRKAVREAPRTPSVRRSKKAARISSAKIVGVIFFFVMYVKRYAGLDFPSGRV